MWKVNATALLLASFLSTPLRSSVSARQYPAGDCMAWAQQKSILATPVSLWGQAILHSVYAARFFSPEPLSVSMYDTVSCRVYC